ncbi:hypothetical protein F5880DRAFT_815488 [Lentinula raphanica]|nr:hypothetical protein F5880DRAFT_815488 [Lentinula raphanica]
MVQHWQLISIDNRATAGHLGEIKRFFWRPSRAIFHLPAVAVPLAYKIDNRSPGDQAKAQRMALESQRSSLLLTLPFELLLIIAEDLGKDYLHLLCFSLTCSFLSEITAHARYHSLCYKLKQESWSGSRIILIGNRSKSLPKTMLTNEEKEELGLPNDTKSRIVARALYHVAYDSFQKLSHIPNDLVFGDQRVRTNPKLHDELLTATGNERHMDWISITRKDCVLQRQHEDSWMLRNLSKREYVILPDSGYIMQFLYNLVGVTEYSFTGTKGTWAGDRIDLTVDSTHRQEHGEAADWMDITSRVAQELESLEGEHYSEDELMYEYSDEESDLELD